MRVLKVHWQRHDERPAFTQRPACYQHNASKMTRLREEVTCDNCLLYLKNTDLANQILAKFNEPPLEF